jgi:hypothetical protein
MATRIITGTKRREHISPVQMATILSHFSMPRAWCCGSDTVSLGVQQQVTSGHLQIQIEQI